jgi:hypothetical protein
MSEQSPHNPGRTVVRGPEAAEFPADDPAVAPVELPPDGPPLEGVSGAPPGDRADLGAPDGLGPAPRLAGRARPGRRAGRSWRSAILCSPGGEFPHRLSPEKRTRLRR